MRIKTDFRSWWAMLRLAALRFSDMDGAQRAGAFANYAFFSLLPLILLSVALASIFVDRDQAGRQVLAYLEPYVPISGDMRTSIFGTIAGVIAAREQAGALAIVMLVWAAMQFLTTLVCANNHAWNVEAYSWWRLLLTSLVLLALLVFVIAASTGIAALVPLVRGWLIGGRDPSPRVFAVTAFIVPLLMLFLGLTVFYRLAPNRKTSLREIWPGALLATALLSAGGALFAFYLRRFSTLNAVYGAFGAVMAFLLWIYLSGCILIFAACLSAARIEIRQPADLHDWGR